ncbi:hypothetical protein GJAV_G00198640 [Gymnothorax javanicus]|nr:hypothetical protein GJAV_G00198640 [Gymnothorax javanicus]
MAEPRVEIESLHFSVGILGIGGGSLLLLVNDYAHGSGNDLIPNTALGVLLLIIASLLAYTGVRRSLSHNPLLVTLCLTVSALWIGSGLVYILAGEGVVKGEEGLRTALVPGLAAFTLALLVIGVVGILQKEVILSLMAFSISLACAHQIAGLFDSGFGLGASAANYLLVCLVGAYFGSGRLLYIITKGRVQPPGTGLKKKDKLTASQAQERNDAVPIGLVMNLLSASVLACPLLGVVPRLTVGQVPWLWTAGVFQFGACILSYRAMDTLAATFYGFVSVLKFGRGTACCTQKSLAESLYQLFYVAYCIAIASQPLGFFQAGTQGVQAAIFVVTAVMLLVTLHNKWAPNGPRENAVILPWVVVSGGALQLLCGTVAFARGKTLESTAFFLYGIMWTVWGLTRFGGLYGDSRGFYVAVGIICFMLFNFFVTGSALFLSKAWFAYALTFQLILISFLLDAVDALPFGYDIGVTIIFGLVSFYCFVANLFNSSFQSPQLPLGDPFIKLSGFGGGRENCPHLPARKATSVQQIAEILKNGGTCGMPTDTVYVLVAACNRPDAVEKAYKIKVHAQDRPMSLWISSVKQLEPARSLINPLLWDFMEAAWPSSISMVIPRGPWLDCFGLGESAKYIGTPQSIALRNPDCTVATHLIDLVGPIATMSANPTGEADTTHHNQVYAKLGEKVDGVLCDGPSPENIASTVIDCTKIETGHIGFFRVGVIPKSQVLRIFEEVHKRHMTGQVNPTFEPDVLGPREGQEEDLQTEAADSLELGPVNEEDGSQ